MKRLLPLLLLCAALAAGQIVGVILPLPPQIVLYLDLKLDQVTRIADNNRRLSDYQLEKARRQAQVNAELAVELAKDPLDAMALGLRYLELESIRRELIAERTRIGAANYELLTADQKTKLAALEAAAKLHATACAAVTSNLATPGEATDASCGGTPSFSINRVYDPLRP